MEKKIFQVPAECRNLIPHFWGLKRAACDELQQNGIEEEPAQAPLEAMQKICDAYPWGSMANYARELKRCYRMSPEALLAYNVELQAPITEDDPLDFVELGFEDDDAASIAEFPDE